MVAPTHLRTTFSAYFDLQVRWGENAGMVNQMVHSLDPFSIDVTTETRRGTDAEVVAYMRTVCDGKGVELAYGSLSLWLGGVLVAGFPLDMEADAARGDGFMAVRVPGAKLLSRDPYRWQVLATAPDGGTALAEGMFRFR